MKTLLIGSHHAVINYAREHNLEPNTWRSVQHVNHMRGYDEVEIVWLHDAYRLQECIDIIDNEEVLRGQGRVR